MEPGVRLLEIKGDRRRASHPTAVRGCVGAVQGGQGHASGVTPWPALPLLSGLCRAVVVHGVEKKNSRADMRGPAAAAASGGRETRGRGRRAADTWGPAAAAASEGREHAGVAGPQAGPRALGLAGPSCLGFRGLLLFSFLFYFSFLFHCLNSNLVKNSNLKLR